MTMKIKGTVLCLSMLGVFLVVCMAFNATSLAVIQRQILGWNYFSHIMMIVMGVGMIAIQKLDFHAYGFTLKQWRYDLSVAVRCLIVWAGFRLILSTIVFQFLFTGFGEEILFRGYMQTRLNEDFGRPWRFRGVSFGPGLLISSALFGVLHLFNPFNPFTGSFDLAVWWAITSSFSGLLFGFLREKTGTVLSTSLAHGLIDLGQVVPLLLLNVRVSVSRGKT
jgi:membrane protease YdiL (CAAX protease family)